MRFKINVDEMTIGQAEDLEGIATVKQLVIFLANYCTDDNGEKIAPDEARRQLREKPVSFLKEVQAQMTEQLLPNVTGRP